MNFVSILVNPIGTTDYSLSKISRMMEPIIYNKLLKKELLKKGDYYE